MDIGFKIKPEVRIEGYIEKADGTRIPFVIDTKETKETISNGSDTDDRRS